VLVLLLAWISLSLAWAENTAEAAGELWRWYLGAIVLGVVVTSLRRPRDARLVVGGFVLGVVLSVLVGLVNDGPGGAGAAAETLTSTEGRLKGGLGDPNFLAAAIVPAIVLAAALMPTVRASARCVLLACVGVLVVGLGATQSRGGAVAAAGAFAAALFIMPRQRTRVVAAGLSIVLVGALYFATYPKAFERITASDGGSGRTDIWQVAWRIAADHPAAGVGLHNFTVYSPRYVRRPGALNNVDLIAERPHVVHNTYLEVATETGVVGLGLFVAVIAASLGAAWRAASMSERRGDQVLGTLARGVLVAVIGVLVAAAFVSLGSDPVLWLLLALGPALLAVAARLPRPDND
jgi:O-antigen ligase